MQLKRPARRSQPETIIALIDVVFFLLVFFMLVGRMDATSPFDVLPAQSTTGTDMPAGGVTVSVSAEGLLALDGTASDRDSALETLRDRVASQPDLLVRVNAHRDAQLHNLLPLVADIDALGARNVMLVVTPAGQ